jgi:hypothetical protein
MRYSIFVIASLIAGWILYSATWDKNPGDQDSSNSFQSDTQRVVYSFKPEAAEHLLEKNNKVEDITNWKDAKQKLESYLEQSKLHKSLRYAATGLQLYDQLDSTLRAHPQVSLAHADLLQFVNEFDAARIILDKLKKQIVNQPTYQKRWDVQPKTMAEKVNVRLFGLHLMRGDLVSSRSACRSLRGSNTPAIPLICDAWIKGLDGASSRSITTLERLVAGLEDGSELKTWCAQALIDLYLFSGEPIKATAAYNFLVKSNVTDLSVASQIVDHLIFNKNEKLALSVLNTQPGSDPLIIRRAIVEERMGKQSSNELKAKALIEVYELTNDPSHYYDIALWYSARMNQPETAQRYADLHWDRFKSFHDQALRQSIDSALNEENDLSKS